MELLKIQHVSTEDVRTQIRSAMRAGLDASRLRDFLASVDWSSRASAGRDTVDLLGRLEQWSTMYAEGDMSEKAYLAALRALLPSQERRARILR